MSVRRVECSWEVMRLTSAAAGAAFPEVHFDQRREEGPFQVLRPSPCHLGCPEFFLGDR